MNCIFCKIAAGEIPANIVKKGDNYVAFRDLNPQAPTHVLIIPKEHFSGLPDVRDANLLGSLMQAAAEIAAELGLDNGFRCVVNTGTEGGQTVFHLHIHLLGGRNMEWPPG
jgi:histidine triad (HIT) family protein